MNRSLDRFVLGTSQLGGLGRVVDDATAQQTLETAWELGVRHFDTAPHYGAGLSERRVGAFLRQFPREEFTLSTKVGRLLVDTDADTEGAEGFFGGDRKRRVLDYSGDGVRRSLEESLQRLGLDRVDTVYVHDPDEQVDQVLDEAWPALAELRDSGVVTHVGAGMNDAAPLVRLVTGSGMDQIMVAGRVTLLDRTGEVDLLPLCAERGVSVVAAGVFNSGLLADPRPGAQFDYAPASDERLDQARRIRSTCDRLGIPPRAAAVQYPLTCPAVAAVAVGCRTAEQVRDNVASFLTELPAGWADHV